MSDRFFACLLLGLCAVAGRAEAAVQEAHIIGRVLDAQSREVIPCTVRIQTSDGSILLESHSFMEGSRSNGLFDKAVPAGETLVSVSRGFDYVTVERRLSLRPGERQELTLELKRRTPLRALGWVCGDNHAHMTHGERVIVVDFPYVALAGKAEGLDYLSVAQQWNLPQNTPDSLDAACQAVSSPDFTLSWNMEAPKNYWRGDASRCLGHCWTLAMSGQTPAGKNPIDELSQMSAWDYESEKVPTPNFESHALIHFLGGIVSYTHPFRWWWGQWGGQGIYPREEVQFVSNLAPELPFDTLAGPTYDCLDILMQPSERSINDKAQQLWFKLLNEGYRIAGTASSDSTFDNEGGGTPGKVRVYTRVEGKPSLRRIAEAMKKGRNFVTSGPLLLLEIDGHPAGDIIKTGRAVRFKAALKVWASGEAGEYLTRAELIRNGEVVKKMEIPDRKTEFTTDFEISETGTSWYLARCFGSTEDQLAITNPVYFEAEDFQPPKPALAHVTLAVSDKVTGQLLDGNCEIISRVGLTSVQLSKHGFKGGNLTLDIPATARVLVRAPGFAPLTKSIFLDYPPVLNITLNSHSSELSEWNTFQQIRNLLQRVHLEFQLVRDAGSNTP